MIPNETDLRIGRITHELAEIELKIKACNKPVEQRTADDRRYFARLLAAYKRRKQKLRALQEEQHQ